MVPRSLLRGIESKSRGLNINDKEIAKKSFGHFSAKLPPPPPPDLTAAEKLCFSVVSVKESLQKERERGTDNIYWSMPFDPEAEGHITTVIERIHSLLIGALEFSSSDNPNKCRACRFRERCDRLCS